MATLANASFKTAPKDVLRVTIGSGEKEITLDVLPPVKEIYEDLVTLAGIVDSAKDGTLDHESFDIRPCIAVVANALSNNTQIRKIQPEHLEEIGFDMQDIDEFLQIYLFFLKEMAKAKNSQCPGTETTARSRGTDTP